MKLELKGKLEDLEAVDMKIERGNEYLSGNWTVTLKVTLSGVSPGDISSFPGTFYHLSREHVTLTMKKTWEEYD